MATRLAHACTLVTNNLTIGGYQYLDIHNHYQRHIQSYRRDPDTLTTRVYKSRASIPTHVPQSNAILRVYGSFYHDANT